MSVDAGRDPRGVNQVLKDLITAGGETGRADAHTRRLEVHSLDWVKRGGGENQLDDRSLAAAAAERHSCRRQSIPSVFGGVAVNCYRRRAAAAVCLVIWRRGARDGRRAAAKMSH